jgi:hypothetical protein
MEAMNPKDQPDLLEECLRELQSGKPLEQILDEHSLAAETLRPVLQAAVLARAMASQQTIPLSAQTRSRAQFLAAAGQARSPRPWMPFARMRLSTSAFALVVVLLVVSVIGSGFASAQSIPGDTLYPVKIAVEQARLNIPQNPATRISLEEQFDKERADETQELLRLGRAEDMTFAGYLAREQDEPWEVAGLHLVLTPAQEQLANAYDGMYVEVQGKSNTQGVVVESIQARLFNLSGQVQQIQPVAWKIGGVTVHTNDRTRISAQANIGQQVFVAAMRQQNGDLVALLISDAPETATYLPPTVSPTSENATATVQPNNDGSESWQEHAPTNAPSDGDSYEQKIATPEGSGDNHESQSTPQPGGDHTDGEHSPSHTGESGDSGGDH